MKTLRELRKERGWTLVEVGHHIGVTHATIHYWETGVDIPNVRRLRQLAALYGVSSDEISLPGLADDKNMTPRPCRPPSD